MALTKESHLLEVINDVRCSVVEKDATPGRVDFLKKLLEHNGYTVIVEKTPPPKVAAKPATAPADVATPPPPPAPATPETFTIAVTDISFHPMLAVYERDLKSMDNRIVSVAYWNQKENTPEDIWYWRK